MQTEQHEQPCKVFWPEEFLTSDVPEARVWTYGYDADAIGGLFQANKNSVSQHGQDLAVKLEREIENKVGCLKSCPVRIDADGSASGSCCLRGAQPWWHRCQGCKPIAREQYEASADVLQAIRRSEPTRSRTKLIMFLGTPHRGSSSGGWGGIASNLVSLALRGSNKGIIKTLDVNSEILDNIHEEFTNIADSSRIKVHSFQEARGMSGMKGLHNKV